jgi:hypothetical protein
MNGGATLRHSKLKKENVQFSPVQTRIHK